MSLPQRRLEDVMAPLAKAGLGDRIVDVLRRRIIAGEFSGDGPIRQDALAADLGVSKIPLREAFAKLEQDGLVTSRINRGFFVRPLSTEEALDVFALRLKIEPDAVAAAATCLRPGDVAKARDALEGLNAGVSARSAETGALNRAFHMALIRPGGTRPVTLQVVERLQVIAERYVVKHLEPLDRPERALVEHEMLFRAWSAGDARRSAELSAAHIASTLDDLERELKTRR